MVRDFFPDFVEISVLLHGGAGPTFGASRIAERRGALTDLRAKIPELVEDVLDP